MSACPNVMMSEFLIVSFMSCRVQGERYFSCRPNYGVFVKPEKVRVGDYPVEEIDFEDEEM